jgi:glycosyltransferase involved in cell wall biosynthesis
MIDILIPVYNGVEFLDECLNSVKAQTYKEWRVIIGINGHPPDSETYRKAVQHECHNIRVLDMPDVKDKSEALNKMREYCTQPWIALLDVDDLWCETKLASQIPFMGRYDVIGIQCQYFQDVSTNISDTNQFPFLPLEDITKFNFASLNPIINSSSLIKRELCWWSSRIRLWKQGCRFYNIGTCGVHHRLHAASHGKVMGNHNYVAALLRSHGL